ncbi:hypothetical protein D3C71_2070680 [compost metagenome]
MTLGMRRLWEEKFWFSLWVMMAIILQTPWLLFYVMVWTAMTLFTGLRSGSRAAASTLISVALHFVAY